MSDEVTVIINGDPFVGWKEVNIDLSFETASNECQIKLSEKPPGGLSFAKGDTLQVLIDGRPVITGNVNSIKVSSKWKDHPIRISGSDKTKDLVKSEIGPKNDFETPITLEDVAKRTIKNMGLDIPVKNLAGKIEPFKRGEVVSGDIVKKGIHFLDGWSQKRQLFLNTDGTGALVIMRGDGRTGTGMLWHAVGVESKFNNVLDFDYDDSEDNVDGEGEGAHGVYAMAAQKSPNDLKHWEGKAKGDAMAAADEMANGYGLAQNTGMRPELRKYFRGQQGAEGKTPDETAKWHANIARARSFKYDAVVEGFHQGEGAGDLWWPGLLVPVRDDDCDIDCICFVKTVNFKMDWKGGATTKIGCTYEDAFRAQANAPKSQSRAAKKGMGHKPAGSYPDVKKSDLGIDMEFFR